MLSGIGWPVSSQKVGRKSQKAEGWSVVVPGWMAEGHEAMQGTRMPPS